MFKYFVVFKYHKIDCNEERTNNIIINRDSIISDYNDILGIQEDISKKYKWEDVMIVSIKLIFNN